MFPCLSSGLQTHRSSEGKFFLTGNTWNISNIWEQVRGLAPVSFPVTVDACRCHTGSCGKCQQLWATVEDSHLLSTASPRPFARKLVSQIRKSSSMLLSHLARDACNADFANHGWSTCEVRTAQKADGLPLTTATSRRQRLTCQAIRSQMCLLHGSAAFSLVQHGSAVQSLIFLWRFVFLVIKVH